MSAAEASSRFRRDDAGRSVSFAACLRSDRVAAAAARRLVRGRLAALVAPSTLEDVLLVVSELVTNAVRHGRGDVELAIAFDGRRVTGHVRDDGASFVRRARERPRSRIGGHGLHLVEQVADGWGIREQSAHVWFEIADEHATVAMPPA